MFCCVFPAGSIQHRSRRKGADANQELGQTRPTPASLSAGAGAFADRLGSGGLARWGLFLGSGFPGRFPLSYRSGNSPLGHGSGRFGSGFPLRGSPLGCSSGPFGSSLLGLSYRSGLLGFWRSGLGGRLGPLLWFPFCPSWLGRSCGLRPFSWEQFSGQFSSWLPFWQFSSWLRVGPLWLWLSS